LELSRIIKRIEEDVLNRTELTTTSDEEQVMKAVEALFASDFEERFAAVETKWKEISLMTHQMLEELKTK